VNGRRYLGKYSREGYKSELAELAESLQNGPLFARYNPLRPDKFFLDPFQDVTEKAWFCLCSSRSADRAPGHCALRWEQNVPSFPHAPFLACGAAPSLRFG
jgi:hypothetical protein